MDCIWQNVSTSVNEMRMRQATLSEIPRHSNNRKLSQASLLPETMLGEDPAYLTEQLITYIGNKRALLNFIGKGLDIIKRKLNKQKLKIADVFSGSGVVSRYAKQYAAELATNDIEAYCEVINNCYLTNKSLVNKVELENICAWLKAEVEKNLSSGFIAELYAPKDEANITSSDRVFYTIRNAKYIDTARQLIDSVPQKYNHLLLAPLLSQASMYANTSGVFKGFYKSRDGVGQYGGTGKNALSRILKDITIQTPLFSRFECDVTISKNDANEFVKSLCDFDVAYIDPPYNQHPYGSNYFMLNLIVDYKRPQDVSKISGIPTNWNRSRYNVKKEASRALFELVKNCDCKFLLISYNSEGFISPDEFAKGLSCIGKLSVLETPYNTFRGSRNLASRAKHVTEFLYILERN